MLASMSLNKKSCYNSYKYPTGAHCVIITELVKIIQIFTVRFKKIRRD